ncbi:hypothetical protein [Pseudoclavibacter sp. VKM Ac-2867]|uniref:hypothetical protein n=1 Tax=Pseudoclavibacter sp. VKM Ac-2867 TaxID=2783829 RepID=UPI00188AE620|nr:hypothetical protein [Pseudoclavibacter sp. VKM Ac-2867]MBF4460529.1 hypothetical protein [Pseudoclavibacter sp. VKM Ac-2867]
MTQNSQAAQAQRDAARGTLKDDAEPRPAGTLVPVDSLFAGDRIDMLQVIEGHIERSSEEADADDYELLLTEFGVPQMITEVSVDNSGRELSFDSGTSWYFSADLRQRGLHVAPDYVPARLEDPSDPAELMPVVRKRVEIQRHLAFEAESELQRTIIEGLRSYAGAVDSGLTAFHFREYGFGNGKLVAIESVTVRDEVVSLNEFAKMEPLDDLEAVLSTRHLHDRGLRRAERTEPGDYTIDITPREARV